MAHHRHKNKKDWVTIRRDNGDVYFGESMNGDAYLWTTYTYANKDVYEGWWAYESNHRHGNGSMRYANGDSYDGHFKNDNEDAWGTYKWANGDVYEGHWKEGNRQGKGKFKCNSGDLYDGDWKDDQKHGEGRFHFGCVDGKEYKQGLRMYTGHWKNDEKCGDGTCEYANNEKYEGGWRDGVCHGWGTHTFLDDGTIIEGHFRNNLMHGRCVQTFVKGDLYDGIWKKGKKHGAGTMTQATGEVYQQVYKHNRLDVSENLNGVCNNETKSSVLAQKRSSEGVQRLTKKRRQNTKAVCRGSLKSKRKDTSNNGTAFRLFFSDFRAQQISLGNQGLFKERGSFMRAGGVAWRNLSPEEKKVYERRMDEMKKTDATLEEGDITASGDGDVEGVSEAFFDDNGVGHQGLTQQPTQEGQKQDDASVSLSDSSIVNIHCEGDNENELHYDNPGSREVGQTNAPQSDNVCALAADANMGKTTRASSSYTSEMSELEQLGLLYNAIKQKLTKSKTRDEKTFYGLLKSHFGRKMRDGCLLSHSDVSKIKKMVYRFESNMELLNDRGNDYDDICVYGGFLKYIINECKKELAFTGS